MTGRAAELWNRLLSRVRRTARRPALEGDRHFLRRVIDASPSLIFVKDRSGRFVLANEALARIYGATPREIVGKTDADFNPNREELEQFRRADLRVIDGRERLEIPEEKVTDSTGRKRHFSTVKVPLFAADGSCDCLLGIATDISAQHAVQERLRESEALFRAVFNQQYQFMAILDAEGRIVDVNDLPLRIGGITREQAIGMRFWETAWWRDLPEMRAEWPRRLERAVKFRGPLFFDDTFQTASGEKRRADASLTPVRDDDDRVRFFIVQASDTTERHRATEQLRRQADLLELSTDAVIVWALDDGITYWNPAATGLYGYTAEEGRGTRSHELLRTRFPVSLEAFERELLRTGYWQGEVLHRSKEGRFIHVESRMRLLEQGGGRMVLEINRDITQQIRDRGALRESAERFQNLADNIAQFAWMADPSGWIFWYNKRWYDYTGTTLEEMQGWGWKKVHHPDHVDRVVKRLQHSWDTGEPWEDTFPLRGRDGHYRWFLSRALPIRDEQGRIVRWFGTNTDITDQLETQRELLETEERVRLAVEAADLGTWALNLRTGEAIWSVRAAEMIGVGPDAPQNFDTFLGRIHPQDRSTITAALERARDPRGDGRYFAEFRTVHPDGSVHWLSDRGAVAFEGEGEHRRPARAVGAVMEITERKRAEQEQARLAEDLRLANTDLLQFGSIASHDLKEPLRGIANLAAFVREDEAHRLSPETSQRLQRVQTLCVRLSSMVDGLLEYARTGEEPKLETCPLDEVLCRVIDTSAEQLTARNTLITLRGHLPTVRGDRLLLERVFANLIANAVKFNTSPIKRIDIFADGDAIAIRDNGIGIDPRHHDLIFRVFRRAHNPDQYAGTGLGLALVKRIVERHHGRISLDSAPGLGTTFRIRLPVLSQGGDGPDRILLSPGEGMLDACDDLFSAAERDRSEP